jgi:hypothetical protein
MIGVLRNIHSRHGLVVREMAARWFLSWSHKGSLQNFLRKAVPMAKHWTNSMMRELFLSFKCTFSFTSSHPHHISHLFLIFFITPSLAVVIFMFRFSIISNSVLSLIFHLISSGLKRLRGLIYSQ